MEVVFQGALLRSPSSISKGPPSRGPPSTFPYKMHLPLQQVLNFSTTDELPNDHNKINVCPYEILLMKILSLKTKRND